MGAAGTWTWGATACGGSDWVTSTPDYRLLLDTSGRALAGCHRALPPHVLHAYALARYALVPVIVACARGSPVWLAGDAVAVLAVAALGLSNGHVGTLAVMQPPPEQKQQQQLQPPAAQTEAWREEEGATPDESGMASLAAQAEAAAQQQQAAPAAAADRNLTGLVLGACLKAGIVAGCDFAVLLAT